MGDINIRWPWYIHQPIHGPAVMFDVVSASYNIIDLVRRCKKLYITTKDHVLDALQQFPDAFLIGETDNPALYEQLKDRFVASNSPRELAHIDVSLKKVILITNNGTHTVVELIEQIAAPVLIGNFANLEVLSDYLLRRFKNKSVTLVPSGGREAVFKEDPELQEDLICATALRELLKGMPHDYAKDFKKARQAHAKQYKKPASSETLDIVFRANIYSVVPLCTKIAPGISEVTHESSKS